MRIGSHEYANEAYDDDDNVPKPAQSLSTPVPRQKRRVFGHHACWVDLLFVNDL